ncbi:MAG: MATE family efflux transporter [Faecalibacterium sp.]
MQEQANPAAVRRPLFTQKELLRLVWPLLVEQLLAVTVGMADTMMVSRCGEAAISGVSLVDMVNNLVIVLFAALATGGAVVVSQYLGAQDPDNANESAGQLIFLSALLGLCVGVLSVLFAAPLIRLFYGSIEADVFEAGVRYLKVTALSYPFLALYNAGAALFRSMGNSKISMQISVLMNVINVVGNAVCIFVLKMGVEGVAWPSVFSRALAAVLILRCCYQKDQSITLPHTFRLDVGMARRILRIGVPSAFENSLFQAGRILVVSMISTFGTVQIAANAVANNLDGMGCIPGQAIGLAMITVVGRCVGAGDHKQTVAYTRRLVLWAYLAMGLFNGTILLFVRQLVGIYELSGETMALAILLVRIHDGCAMLLWPVSFVLPNALRAANDVRFTMVVSILSMAVWRIGFSYLLGVRMGYGAVGVWIAMVVDWICRTICFVARFASGRWKTKYQA